MGHVGLQCESAEGLAALRFPRSVDHHCDGAVDTCGYQAQQQLQVVAVVALGEVEVFIAHDGTIGVVHDVVGVVAQVVGSLVFLFRFQCLLRYGTVRCSVRSGDIATVENLLRPLVLSRLGTSVPAGDAGRVALKGIESIQGEAFGVVLTF